MNLGRPSYLMGCVSPPRAYREAARIECCVALVTVVSAWIFECLYRPPIMRLRQPMPKFCPLKLFRFRSSPLLQDQHFYGICCTAFLKGMSIDVYN